MAAAHDVRTRKRRPPAAIRSTVWFGDPMFMTLKSPLRAKSSLRPSRLGGENDTTETGRAQRRAFALESASLGAVDGAGRVSLDRRPGAERGCRNDGPMQMAARWTLRRAAGSSVNGLRFCIDGGPAAQATRARDREASQWGDYSQPGQRGATGKVRRMNLRRKRASPNRTSHPRAIHEPSTP